MRQQAIIVCLMASLLALFACREAFAHDFPVERSLLAQVSAGEMELMLVYKEPAGARTDLLLAKFDLDNDGELRGGELKLAEGELTRRAFQGLKLEIEGERAGMHEPEMRVKRDQDGGLAVAFYLKYDLPDPVLQRILVVMLSGTADTTVPLILVVEAGDGLSPVESGSPIVGSATRPTELTAPTEHRTFFRVEEIDPKGSDARSK